MISDVEQFSLPLDPDQFGDALRRGLGRAPMHIARFGAAQLQEVIIAACLQAQAYDPQCEVDRVAWLIGMIDAAGIEDAVLPQILQALRHGFTERGFWDKNQLCRLALEYAKRGRRDTRRVLYSALSKNDFSADIFASEEIIELDGGDGLLYVAEKVGEWITDDPESSAGTFLVQFYDESHGDGSAERILRSAAEHNQQIASLLKHLDAEAESDDTELRPRQGTLKPEILERFGWNKPDRFDLMRNWTAEDIIRDIQETESSENRHRLLYRGWGRKASERDLMRIVEALFAESDSIRQYLYLYVFQLRSLPQMDGRFLDLAESADTDIRWITYQILSNHENPKVRSLALDRIRTGKTSEGELRLLTKNYKVGDWPSIRGALRLTSDHEVMHDVFQGLLDVFEINSEPEMREPMMLVYEHTPCSECRGRAVKVLLAIDALPDWVREECSFDVDESTRRLVVGT